MQDKEYIKIFEINFLVFFIGGFLFEIIIQFSNISAKYPNQDIYPMINIAGALGGAVFYFIAGLIISFIGIKLFKMPLKIALIFTIVIFLIFWYNKTLMDNEKLDLAKTTEIL